MLGQNADGFCAMRMVSNCRQVTTYLYGLEMQEGGGTVCPITPNLLKGLLDLLYSTHASSLL